MLSLGLSILLAVYQKPPEVKVDFKGYEFILRQGKAIEHVPLTPPIEPKLAAQWPPKRMLFRKDAAFAVWDSRGLSVRQKSWVFTTKLVEIPTSPKLFTREEILHTKELVDSGRRTLEAAGLSGAVRDGPSAYFLARWEEKDHKPWLETLIKVDLTEEKPKPKLVGRFEGLSLDLKPGSSRLFIREEKPAAWVKTAEAWGLGLYDTSSDTFEFKKVGGQVERVELVDDRIGWFVEQTGFPSRILCRWDKRTLAKRELIETRGALRLLDGNSPWIAVLHEDEGSFLENLETGARQRLPDGATARRTQKGVLVWTPESKPDFAILYDPARWTRVGSWEAK